MTDRRDDTAAPDSREQRLALALRANLARRKAQARARAAGAGTAGVPQPGSRDEADNKTVPDADGETGKDS